MPRVDETYLDARRREILAAAHRCFARNGFQETTMRDVAEEVGLSVGALYRYFDGKKGLIEALAGWGGFQKRSLIEELEPAAGIEGLAALVARLLASLTDPDEADRAVRFDVRMWGEALGRAELEPTVRDSLAQFRGLVADYVAGAQASGRVRDDLDADTVARLLLSLLTGLELQLAFEPGLDREAYERGVRTLLTALHAP